MELEKKYFHSVHSYRCSKNYDTQDRLLELEEILNKYHMIAESGFILPYREIEKKYGIKVNRNIYVNLNGLDCVSVSLHINNPNKIEIKEAEKDLYNLDDAWNDFVIQEPSIVLNEIIKEKLKFLKYSGIHLERLVKEPISLEYMDAIAMFVPNSLLPFFRYGENLDYDKLALDKVYRDWPIEYIDQLLEIFDNNHYHIKLYNVLTGEEFKDNQEYRKVLKQSQNKNINRRYFL